MLSFEKKKNGLGRFTNRVFKGVLILKNSKIPSFKGGLFKEKTRKNHIRSRTQCTQVRNDTNTIRLDANTIRNDTRYDTIRYTQKKRTIRIVRIVRVVS